MTTTPYYIASYPRSGSTWLRFILANLYFPGTEHTMATVDHLISYIDDPKGWAISAERPYFIKTHRLNHNRQRVIWLHRHVGDVLISEWWYKRKFHAEARSFEDYIQDDGMGQNWRANVDYYFPSLYMLGYHEIGEVSKLKRILDQIAPGFSLGDVNRAMGKSSFTRLQEVETKGFGIYPAGNPEIKFFRNGTSGQWRSLAEETKQKIITANYIQLRLLGYESPK